MSDLVLYTHTDTQTHRPHRQTGMAEERAENMYKTFEFENVLAWLPRFNKSLFLRGG